VSEFHSSVQVLVAPPVEPLSLGVAKQHLRIDFPDDDSYIALLITAAREKAEADLRRALVRRTLVYRLDGFPIMFHKPGEWWDDAIKLPYAPLISVASVQYVDVNGITQTVDPSIYQVDSVGEPGRLKPAWNCFWPPARRQLQAVTITYDAGYAENQAVSPTDYAANIPQGILHAIRLLISHWYENREPVVQGAAMQSVPMAYESLIWTHRVLTF
jgi:uncharacterized phiE125 gp8 family phage protein